jgi:hypothetical protein
MALGFRGVFGLFIFKVTEFRENDSGIGNPFSVNFVPGTKLILNLNQIALQYQLCTPGIVKPKSHVCEKRAVHGHRVSNVDVVC